MKITNISIEKSFTLSLNEGYRKVTVKAEAVTDDLTVNEYNFLSDFITERMKEEKAKFTSK